MNTKCHKCGAAATAGPDPAHRTRQVCLTCAAVESITIPPNPERRAPAPPELVNGPAWNIAKAMSPDGQLWSHQAAALEHLTAGQNVVVATPTASGKSLIFQLWSIHRLQPDPGGHRRRLLPHQGAGQRPGKTVEGSLPTERPCPQRRWPASTETCPCRNAADCSAPPRSS